MPYLIVPKLNMLASACGSPSYSTPANAWAQSSTTRRLCCRAKSRTGPISVRPPNRWATRIIFVAGVIACRHCSSLGAIRCGSRSTGTATSPWCSIMRIMSGIVIAETSTSVPRGKSSAARNRSNPLRTERHASVLSAAGQSDSTRRETEARSGGTKTRPAPNSRSDQPISNLFLDHTMQFFSRRKRVSVNSLPSRAFAGGEYNARRQSIVDLFSVFCNPVGPAEA